MTVPEPAQPRDWCDELDLDAKDFSDSYEEVLSKLMTGRPVARS